jgi:ABC-2 type transport system ATP-binding protein
MAEPVIQVSGLTKYYRKNKGVENLSLQISKGDIYGLIGPHGSGKTAFIRLLLGYVVRDEGEMALFGEKIGLDLRHLKHRIGYAPSEAQYYEDLKVKQLLKFSAKFYQKDSSARIKELTEIFSLPLNESIEDLSLLDKHKLSIVLALMHEPELLILDEPFNGLDDGTKKTLVEVLQKESEKGATILVTSHSLLDVQNFCQQIGFIKEGIMVKETTTEEIRNLSLSKWQLELNQDMDINLKGISAFKKENSRTSFIYAGQIGTLLQVLSGFAIKSLSVQEPDFEDVLLHFSHKEES